MPGLKTNAIQDDTSGTLWDVILHTPGQKVRVRSGGRLLEVVKHNGSDVLCRLGARDLTLPRAILTAEVNVERKPRRGRRVRSSLLQADAPPCVVPGEVFDTDELARMREEYASASARLGLEAKPHLAREVAIAILRSAKARH